MGHGIVHEAKHTAVFLNISVPSIQQCFSTAVFGRIIPGTLVYRTSASSEELQKRQTDGTSVIARCLDGLYIYYLREL